MWKLAETYRSRSNPGVDAEGNLPDPPSLPLSAQSDEVRSRVADRYKRLVDFAKVAQEPPPPPPDRVSATVHVVLEAEYPVLGARVELAQIPSNTLHPETPTDDGSPVVAWPTRGVRCWSVALPENDEGAETLVSVARRTGVAELRVVVPEGEEPLVRLASLGRRAKTAGVALVPTLYPFVAATEDTVRDVDFLGRTAREFSSIGDASVPDLAEPERIDVGAIVRRCRQLANLEGVTGIAFAQLSPPGYGSLERGWNGLGQWRERLGFVREHGIDPADFASETDGMQGELLETWLRRTADRRDAFFRRLDHAFLPAKLPVPLTALGSMGWETWRTDIATTGSDRRSPNVLIPIPVDVSPVGPDADDPMAFLSEVPRRRATLRATLESVVGRETYGGIVIDATHLSADAAVKYLASLFLDEAIAASAVRSSRRRARRYS